MSDSIKSINRNIENTKILVFNYNSKTKLYTYSNTFDYKEVKNLASEVNKATESYGNRFGLSANVCSVAQFAGYNGLYNMYNPFSCIVANNVLKKLTNNSKSFPTIEQGVELKRADMLPYDSVINFGIVLYGEEDPNKEIIQDRVFRARQINIEKITKYLNGVAKQKNLALPVLFSTESFDLEMGEKEFEIMPRFISEKGLIHGKEAREFLKKNHFEQGEFGISSVNCDWNGRWQANSDRILDTWWYDHTMSRYSVTGDEKQLREEALNYSHLNKNSLDSVLASVA